MNMFNFPSKFQGFNNNKKRKILQLFRATDFESLMYPCFTFCRILGIFPYKINASTIKIYKPCYILSAIITCIFCVIELKTLYDMNSSKNTAFKSILRILERDCFHIFGGSIIVFTFILTGPRMRLLQTILEISLRLPQESYQNLSRLIHTKDVFLFFSIVVQASIYYHTMQLSIFRKILLLYIILLVFQMDMLYINCVCVLKACFKQINDNLANIREPMTNGEPCILRETYKKQRNPFLLMELKALEKQHLEISNTVQMLNTTFSLQLLSTIVMTFAEIIFNLYFYLMRIQKGVSMSNLEKQIYYKYFIACVTYYFTKILMIIWACETGKNQAMEINTTVHDMFNGTGDEEIKYELQLFSLQLIHRETVFSAKALTVDAKLLTSMVGGITTYLLILIQFLIMSDSCNERSLINFIDNFL